MRPLPIIFTDLDGTLLDYHTYSFAAALSALELIKENHIPLVFCSSKTRAEIEHWRTKLSNAHPFISENGGGVFIPRSYFSHDHLNTVAPRRERTEVYDVFILGTPYPSLRQALEEVRREGFEITGFGDMDVTEIAQHTELSPEEAALAKVREFDEPFVFSGEGTRLDALIAAVEEKGLRCIAGGRLLHLTGSNDKGAAVELLTQLYRRKFGRITTVALGDSPNDFPMLERVDHPILVRNPRGEHDSRVRVPHLIRADGIGPVGWREGVLTFLQKEHTT
jgi:mannosyl-3-phosphoglycerate phosphatase